jgi:carbamate kinase
MAAITRNRVAEVILSTTCAAVVLGGIAAMDDNVRGQMAGVLTGQSANPLARVGAQANGMIGTLLETAWASGTESTVLTALVIASVTLVVLMLKS